MPEYGFELHVDASALATDPENVVDALYESGLDDAIVAWRDTELLVQVDRTADSLAEAIMSAIAQVDGIDGLAVQRVEPVDLVSIGEIARRKSKTKAWASMIVSGKRGSGTFPPPIVLTHNPEPRWRWADVEAWFDSESQPDPGEITQLTVIVSVLNALLELRQLRVEEEDRNELLPLMEQAGLVAS